MHGTTNPKFCGIFGIFDGVLKSLFIYSAFSRETPNDDVRIPGWGTRVYVMNRHTESTTFFYQHVKKERFN